LVKDNTDGKNQPWPGQTHGVARETFTIEKGYLLTVCYSKSVNQFTIEKGCLITFYHRREFCRVGPKRKT
jgi:hypothetical protein